MDLKPFANQFQISNIQHYLKQGEWIVEDNFLIIKSSYRKTSFELPVEGVGNFPLFYLFC
ncbi:hypothetical protein [Bacillus sp. JJ722]|uniref:hypothetical protein n=1 Tax=Bacillus sp. JJ722 TaxID=3122973 RepID=UPI002FFDCEDD